MRRRVIAAAILTFSAASPDAAQVRGDAGAMVEGRVVAAFQVTMQLPGAYGEPVPDVRLLVVDASGQRQAVRTDEAGQVKVGLAPGAYRVLTPTPVEWRGERYSWDLPVAVQEGMRIVNLSQANAAPTTAAAAAPVRNESQRQSGGATPAAGAPRFKPYKDGTAATLLSLVLPGGGHMYAGENGKGAALLVTYVGGVVLILAEDTDRLDDPDAATGQSTAGAVLVLGSMIYGLVDAHNAARRTNRKNGYETASRPAVRPVYAREAGGNVRVGAAVSFAY